VAALHENSAFPIIQTAWEDMDLLRLCFSIINLLRIILYL